MSAYVRPQKLDEALHELSGRAHVILAGATDLFPADATAAGWGKPGLAHDRSPPLLDISAISVLHRIERFDDRVEMGALVTWSDAIASDLPAWFDGVRLAAVEVGGRQIQNRGTLAGNVCNASPAADGVPPLLSLAARVRLERLGGVREVDLGQFVVGNRRTCIEADELVTAIVIPTPAPASKATFLKLGTRRYLVISIAMTAVCLEIVGGQIRDPRVAVGACSEVAVRLRPLEERLSGADAKDAARLVRASDFDALTPITDIRASAQYRYHGARVLVERALASLTTDAMAPSAAT